MKWSSRFSFRARFKSHMNLVKSDFHRFSLWKKIHEIAILNSYFAKFFRLLYFFFRKPCHCFPVAGTIGKFIQFNSFIQFTIDQRLSILA